MGYGDPGLRELGGRKNKQASKQTKLTKKKGRDGVGTSWGGREGVGWSHIFWLSGAGEGCTPL